MTPTWLLIIGITVALWLLLAFAVKMPKVGRLPVAAAIALGLAGYAWQGQPGLASAPVVKTVKMDGFGEVIDQPLAGITDQYGAPARWIALSDALERQGNSSDAARVLYGGAMRYPDSVDMWVAYGNALTNASEGVLTPAALAAFEKAAALNPNHPGPPLFLGLAAAQKQDWASARQIWGDLLARSPKDAPWRADLESRMKMLDAAEAQDRASAPSAK